MNFHILRPIAALIAMLTIFGGAHTARADDNERPAAAPADVESVDAIMAAVYDVISGPAGQPRDWDRFRSLFIDGARLMPLSATQGVIVLSPEDYIARAGASLIENGFFEQELARVTEEYGGVVHAFSSYAARRALNDPEPFLRGINSFQLAHFQNRWWVVSILWRSEDGTRPIPDRYLP